jgi:hypothetical protein
LLGECPFSADCMPDLFLATNAGMATVFTMEKQVHIRKNNEIIVKNKINIVGF